MSHIATIEWTCDHCGKKLTTVSTGAINYPATWNPPIGLAYGAGKIDLCSQDCFRAEWRRIYPLSETNQEAKG